MIKKDRKEIKLSDRIKNLLSNQYSPSDPNGSYTGTPENKFEKPIQDADDL